MSKKPAEPVKRVWRAPSPGNWVKRGGLRLIDRSDRFLARFRALPVAAFHRLQSVRMDGRFNWAPDWDRRVALIAAAAARDAELLASSPAERAAAAAGVRPDLRAPEHTAPVRSLAGMAA